MKIEFSSQRREMLLFLTDNMAAVTSRANQQLGSKGEFLEKLTGDKPGTHVTDYPPFHGNPFNRH